jgi:collagenase-like PrtC family protease
VLAALPGDLRAIKLVTGMKIEVFAWCRAEFLLHGRCGLTGYAAERPDGTTASAKRGTGCRLVCRALPVPRNPRTLEDDLPLWIRAGADVFKIEGRDLSLEALKEVVARFRRRLDAAVSGSAVG